MKKILLLGGSAQQIPAITTARAMGIHTVLCDYLPDSPGRKLADTFYLVSTTDESGVLEVAQTERVDGVLAYASDPAALTAAYVADKMGLPGNSYQSIQILTDKERFRDFLVQHNFNSPTAQGYGSIEAASREIGKFKLPVVVKPVDSSGSKGVSVLNRPEDLLKQARDALEYSRNGRFIIEEYVAQSGYQVAGDGFSVDGKLRFWCFGNDHFDRYNANPLVPIAASFPYQGLPRVQEKIKSEIQRLLSLLNMRSGAYNFDIRIDKHDNVYLMEIGPRNGGNYIPQVIKYATGVDLVQYSIKAAMGENCTDLHMVDPDGFWSYYAIHSARGGLLEEIKIDQKVREENVWKSHLLYEPGNTIPAFTGSNRTIGILIMKFAAMEEMLQMMDNADRWLEVVVV